MTSRSYEGKKKLVKAKVKKERYGPMNAMDESK